VVELVDRAKETSESIVLENKVEIKSTGFDIVRVGV